MYHTETSKWCIHLINIIINKYILCVLIFIEYIYFMNRTGGVLKYKIWRYVLVLGLHLLRHQPKYFNKSFSKIILLQKTQMKKMKATETRTKNLSLPMAGRLRLWPVRFWRLAMRRILVELSETVLKQLNYLHSTSRDTRGWWVMWLLKKILDVVPMTLKSFPVTDLGL